MRTATKTTLATDLAIQGILVGAMLIFYVLGLLEGGLWGLGLLAQFFVGVVQVTSGVLHSIAYKDKTRIKYTTFAIPYVAALILFGNLIGNWGFVAFFVIFVILIPVAIAIWYTNLTYRDWKKAIAPKTGTTKKSYEGHENVLDDVEWL